MIRKHQFLYNEIVKESCFYNFTLTLNPFLYSKLPIDQIGETSHILVNIMREIMHVVNITIVIELTTNMNVHYHGIFTVNLHKYKSCLIVNRFFNTLRKKSYRKFFGTSRCYQTEHLLESEFYLQKDIFETYALLDRKIYPFVIDTLHIDDHFTFQLRFTDWLKTAAQQFLHDPELTFCISPPLVRNEVERSEAK